MSLNLLVARAQAVGGIKRAYKVGDVPKKPKAPYVVIGVDSGSPSTYTLDATSDSMHLVTVQCFGEEVDDALDMADLADRAFRDKPLTELPGEPMCNRILGTSPVRDPDGEELIYLLHTYRFHQED